MRESLLKLHEVTNMYVISTVFIMSLYVSTHWLYGTLIVRLYMFARKRFM